MGRFKSNGASWWTCKGGVLQRKKGKMKLKFPPKLRVKQVSPWIVCIPLFSLQEGTKQLIFGKKNLNYFLFGNEQRGFFFHLSLSRLQRTFLFCIVLFSTRNKFYFGKKNLLVWSVFLLFVFFWQIVNMLFFVLSLTRKFILSTLLFVCQ